MPKAAQYYPEKDEFADDKGITLTICQCSSCGLVQHNLHPVAYFKEVITAASLSEKSRLSRLNQMKALPDYSKARVLILGDVMLDRYWHGDTRRISPEAPVPVVKVGKEEMRPGGAANVALNIASLGGNATLLGLIGDDEHAEILLNALNNEGVACGLVKDSKYPTITKLRVISQHQRLKPR